MNILEGTLNNCVINNYKPKLDFITKRESFRTKNRIRNDRVNICNRKNSRKYLSKICE